MVFLKKVDLLFLMTMSQIKIPKTSSWEFFICFFICHYCPEALGKSS